VGSGALGFEEPKFCVQVKSGTSTITAPDLRSFQGALSNFGEKKGLYVSWGGFTKEARAEARRKFFSIRLWDSDTLIDELLKHYEKLSDIFQAELPLKRIWTLVESEES